MLADAVEMDLPIQTHALAWDFFPLNGYSTDKRFLSYIFAEQQSQIAPIFDMLTEAKIYPTGALFPLSIEFSSAVASVNGNSLQLCLNSTVISMVFTGGDQPYMRCLPYGLDRVLGAETDDKDLQTWLRGDSVEEEVEKKINEFLREVAKEIHICELYYFHHFKGKPFTQLRLCSNGEPMARVTEFLKKCLGRDVDVVEIGKAEENQAIFGTCDSSALGDITRIHLAHGARMICSDHMNCPAALVPPVVTQRQCRVQRIVACFAIGVFACGILLLANFHRGTQNYVLQKQLAHMRQRLDQERIMATSAAKINGELLCLRTKLDRADWVRTCQGFWLGLFQGLQDALVEENGGWLDGLRTLATTPDALREIRISGNILGAGDREKAIQLFLNQLEDLPFIASIADLTLATVQANIQPFHCKLVLSSKGL
jgi:hypothetical protein